MKENNYAQAAVPGGGPRGLPLRGVREGRRLEPCMKWLFRLTYLYLVIPFIIFCLGWSRLAIAIPVVAILGWVLWRLLSQEQANETAPGALRTTIYALLITGLWVFLSGVGGYAFQNWDHHWRNAVFRDLITYDWPVVYAAPDRGPVKMLVYYVGQWLSSALVGKLFGWQAANAFLFLWTWLGILLVVLHLSFKIKTSSLKSLLLLAFFSGMDALGAIFFAKDYPTLWPPIQHLEIWSGNLQYSSFTTQLFWVFNQSVPAWLCVALFFTLPEGHRDGVRERSLRLRSVRALRPKSLDHDSGDSSLTAFAQNDMLGHMAFTWSLCFFFAPLASIGLVPYLLIEWFEHIRPNLKSAFKNIRLDLLLASALIFLLSYFFFSSNTAAQQRGIQALALKDVLVFFLLEGGIIWLLLAPRHWRDPRWTLTGILLFIMPFIQLGSGRDFVMRASIAPLFYLMVWCGELLFHHDSLTTKAQSVEGTKKRYSVLQIVLAVCLVIGVLTPLYEINRSIYRTYEYYFLLSGEQRVQPGSEPTTHLEQGGAPEAEHPGSLVADEIRTLTFMDDQLTKNFVANVRQSLYYRYIAPR
jgi:hypothetical protein